MRFRISFLIVLICSALSTFGQVTLNNAQLQNAQLGKTNAPSGGGGGCTPSYSGGTGDRSASITVTAVSGLINTGGDPEQLVKGSLTGVIWFTGGIDLGAADVWVKFYFNGVPTLTTEWTWYQDTATSQGTWQWEGSNDDVSYTPLGGTFVLGGATIQVQTSLSGNTIKYLYYRLHGVSGVTSSVPFQLNVENKSCQ